MSIETVFGSAGHDHITGAQLARMIEGTVGKGDYVLRTQNELAATMQTANTVRIDTGDLVHDGRLATCERYTDLAVDSGVSGMRRHDLVVARFSKASDQHQLVVVKGSPTAGEPTDPKLNDGAAGIAATADMPLWRVKLDGISPTLERVFEFAPTSKELRDSVSQPKTLWHGAWFGANGEAKLSEPLSAQKNGMVLVWSAYEDGEAKDWSWVYTYVPRWHAVADTGTRGVVCSAVSLDYAMAKYLYVYDDKIGSYPKNEQTVSVGGLTAENGKWVLRYALGV